MAENPSICYFIIIIILNISIEQGVFTGLEHSVHWSCMRTFWLQESIKLGWPKGISIVQLIYIPVMTTAMCSLH